MNKEKATLATEDDLLVELTLNNVPAYLLTEFAEKIVGPYYNSNLNAAVRDLLQKALTEQEFVHTRINLKGAET